MRGLSIVRLIAWTAGGAALLGAYWLTAGQYCNPDAFAYAEVAQRVLAGDKLYAEAWQDKPPFAIFFYIVPQLVAPRSAGALQFWLGVWVLLQGAVAIVCAGPRATSLQRCVVVSLLALLPLSSNDFIWASTVNTANLPVVVMLFVSYRLMKHGAISLGVIGCVGICWTLAFNVRQNTVLFGIVPLTAILLSHVERRQTALRLAGLAGGVAAGWLVVLCVVLGTSSWPDYFDTVFLYPRRYATISDVGNGVAPVTALLTSLLKAPVGIMGATFAALSLAEDWRKTWKLKLLLLGTIFIGMLLCVLPLKPYPHYWASLIPVVALLAFDYAGSASGAQSSLLKTVTGSTRHPENSVELTDREAPAPVLQQANRRQPALVSATLCGLLVAFAAINCADAQQSSKNASLNEVAAAVNRATTPADTIYILSSDGAYLCYFTTARPAHRVSCCFQLNPYWSKILPENIRDVLAEYESHPPTILVAQVDVLTDKGRGSNMVDLANRLMKRYDYVLVDTVNGHWIFKLKGAGLLPDSDETSV
jgi:hypothetical protein